MPGWQWIAGCGADAAPFFRIFNPITQSEKFDKQGEYIRRHVPELADHAGQVYSRALVGARGNPRRCRRGRSAPITQQPVVDIKESRERALAGVCTDTKTALRQLLKSPHGAGSRLTLLQVADVFKHQCLKCRIPVNTIAIPCSLAAAITSSSRMDPPG